MGEKVVFTRFGTWATDPGHAKKRKKYNVGHIFRHLWNPGVRDWCLASADLQNYSDSNGTRWVDHFLAIQLVVVLNQKEKEILASNQCTR